MTRFTRFGQPYLTQSKLKSGLNRYKLESLNLIGVPLSYNWVKVFSHFSIEFVPNDIQNRLLTQLTVGLFSYPIWTGSFLFARKPGANYRRRLPSWNRFLVRWNLNKWEWIGVYCTHKYNRCKIVIYQFNICFINWDLILKHFIKIKSFSAAQMSIW